MWLARRRGGAAAAIEGTLLITAVIVALSEKKDAGAAALAEATAGTAVVFWLAHVYADVVGERAGEHRRHWRTPGMVLADEWPSVESALLPVVTLLLGAVGAFSRDTAVWVAIAIAVAELTVWGYVATRRMGAGVPGAIAGGVFNALLGGVVVLLKALIH